LRLLWQFQPVVDARVHRLTPLAGRCVGQCRLFALQVQPARATMLPAQRSNCRAGWFALRVSASIMSADCLAAERPGLARSPPRGPKGVAFALRMECAARYPVV